MKTLDYNSVKNQAIKSKFVEREVLTCFTCEMGDILNTYDREGPKLPSWDDVENLYENPEQCSHCGRYLTEIDKNSCSDCEQDIDQEPQEIYEWWIVSKYLYEKLSDRKEPVLEWGNNFYWGRTCTGQAIMLDGVISRICQEMEILEGQQFEWK